MTLYIVGTPIGNLSDASPRMIDTLKSAALIAAEDTRVTAKLCARFDIRTPMISYREHNERPRADELVARMLDEGIDVALVTDAGMPSISDPGAVIAARARAVGIPITCIPGPCAAVTALALSGWEDGEHTFAGFLPREKKPLREALSRLSRGAPVAVMYESPHRLRALLEAIADMAGAERVLVCNDLTKLHEWVFEGTPREALEALAAKPSPEKGEYCVAVRFARLPEPEPAESLSPEAMLLEAMLSGLVLDEASADIQARGVSRNDAYRAGLAVKRFLEKYSKK